MSSDLPSASSEHAFTIVDCQTAEEIEAWSRGEMGLFDDVEAWLDDVMPGRFRAERDILPGVFDVAVDDEVDAVLIKLRWCDHLVA